MFRFTRAILLTALAYAGGPNPGASDFFETRIRPIVAGNCFPCHSDSKLGGLSLNSREAFLRGGNSGPAVVPGKPDQSLLIQAVRREHQRIKMPPQVALMPVQIAALEEWVKAGAVWPEDKPQVRAASTTAFTITAEQRAFWAFQPVQKPALPPVKASAWVKSPIDRFILAKLEEHRLKLVPQAAKGVWLRRATLDLTGLPPSTAELDAFIHDKSSDANAKVIDRLLASPRYGERWGRNWLDVARYSDDHLTPDSERPYPNAFRYRDWVIQALNDDMPYDVFIKAQIAGDLLPDKNLAAGTGLYGLSPDFQDDRVDVTTRGFLALTAACAQCHDHKFDPVPTADFYALQGIFNSTRPREYPLVSESEVQAFTKATKLLDGQNAILQEFLKKQANDLAEVLSTRTAAYLAAASNAGPAAGLDQELLDRWVIYLGRPKNHPFLMKFESLIKRGAPPAEIRAEAKDLAAMVADITMDKKTIDEKNYLLMEGSKDRPIGDPRTAKLLTLTRDRFVFWRDLCGAAGVLYFAGNKLDRFLSPVFLEHVKLLRAKLADYKQAIPSQFPFIHGIEDVEKASNMRIQIRGNRDNPGDEAPRAFLSILSQGRPKPFTKGSGRLELAEAIADAANPLTARVIVNRIWAGHFGRGIVGSLSNFGMLGERPTHPELLDYLAATFIENKWSIKALHRAITLSAAYGMSAMEHPENKGVDAGNRFFWHFERRRLEAEAVRDSILFVSGTLDTKAGGPPVRWTGENFRRSVYGFVSRRQVDPVLALFDFPNPNSTSEQRMATDVPLQRLFLLNSATIMQAAAALARRVGEDGTIDARIGRTYRLLFARSPAKSELKLGMEFIAQKGSWPEYMQVLMSSNEFLCLK